MSNYENERELLRYAQLTLRAECCSDCEHNDDMTDPTACSHFKLNGCEGFIDCLGLNEKEKK